MATTATIVESGKQAKLAFYPVLKTVNEGEAIFTLLRAGNEQGMVGYVYCEKGVGYLLANDPNFLEPEFYKEAFDTAKGAYEGGKGGIYTFGNVNALVLELE